MASAYIHGFGVQKDDERGLKILEQAAETGHPEAMFKYAEALDEKGWYNAFAKEKAIAFYKYAALCGNYDAVDRLVRYYYLRNDFEAALFWIDNFIKYATDEDEKNYAKTVRKEYFENIK